MKGMTENHDNDFKKTKSLDSAFKRITWKRFKAIVRILGASDTVNFFLAFS